MLCDDCRENDAVVQLKAVKDNAVVQLHLCERCAAKRGVETTINTFAKHPLGEFIQAVHQQASSSVTAPDARRCTFCGTTMADFRSTGRWGCSRCYAQFERGIRELLRQLHGNSKHVGRGYEPPAVESMEKLSALGELRERLRKAVESEQFELAADIRDRIKVLE